MLKLDHVTKTIQGRPIIQPLSLEIPAGQWTVILGRSGSGKSTLLRLMNRLIEPDSGSLTLNGTPLADTNPTQLRRGIGYVIQQFGLFPHKTVFDNIATVPTLLRWPRARIHDRVHELLDLFELPAAEYAKRYPHELSGGQQQRVGVARALAANPPLLLMDEPFGALDPIIRRQAQLKLKSVQRQFNTTVVMVTHDLEEAFYCADHICVLQAGQLVHASDPLTLLKADAHPEVQALLGEHQRAFKILSLIKAHSLAIPGEPHDKPKVVRIVDADANGADVLAELIRSAHSVVRVRRADGAYVGHVTLDALLARLRNTH